MKNEQTKSVKSSGNVFEDLGFEKTEAANMLLRTDLMIELERFIRTEKMSQRVAAKFFGVHQPRINDLMNRRSEKFSIDVLVNMVHATGKTVELQLRKLSRIQ